MEREQRLSQTLKIKWKFLTLEEKNGLQEKVLWIDYQHPKRKLKSNCN